MATRGVTPHAIAALLLVGRRMSNLCFNLSQHQEVIGAESMAELYREWDKAMQEYRRVEPKKRKAKYVPGCPTCEREKRKAKKGGR